MLQTSENNWYTWTQNENEFTTHFSSANRPIGSFEDELIYACRSIREYANVRPTVMFSGGIDSELVLRSFLKAGITPEVVVMQYENDYNDYDVAWAKKICAELDVDYKIHPFNLQKFYENDAERVSELSMTDRPKALPYCKMLEDLDAFVVTGGGDTVADRVDSNLYYDPDYSHKGDWKVRCLECDIAADNFMRAIDRPGVPLFFKWTPGLVASFLRLEWFQKLTNDYYIGKQSVASTKIEGYRSVYPMMEERIKKTGFEKIDHLANEFEDFLIKKNGRLLYRRTSTHDIYDILEDIML